jgi:putative CocE/NonD family hydrolase
VTTPVAATPFRRFAERAEAHAGRPALVHTTAPMRDRVELAADVYLPAEPLPVPAIVEVTPYDAHTSSLIKEEARFYQSHGYAFVAVDARGRGRSGGEWVAFVHDGPDTHDVIEWAAAQDWCDGGVGTTGLSYMGWVQWAAAAERPPHLRCMVSTSAAGRWQQEIPYTNGVFQLYFAWWAFRVRGRISESSGRPPLDWTALLSHLPVAELGDLLCMSGPTWNNLLEHDTLDDFWRGLRLDGRYRDIDVPCLHVTGWYDLEDLPGAFHHFESMVADSPARGRQFLVVGPWSHVQARLPHTSCGGRDFGAAAAVDMDAVHLRWFDHWLKGRDNGVPDDPRIRVFEVGTDRWRDLDRWPAAEEGTGLYLGFDGRDGGLRAGPGDGDPPRLYRYDPADPVPTGVDFERYPVEDVPLDRSADERRPDVVAYSGEILRSPLLISGWPHLELFASSDCDDTDWHVKLLDVHPDGRSYKVTQGCLRAACRESLERPAPLTPGQVYRFDVELWPAHHAFLPGHRIRVTVTSSDFPWFARNLNRFGPIAAQRTPRTATNRIYHGARHPSRIWLPVAPDSGP